MNKTELIAAIAAETDTSNAAAGRMVDSFTSVIERTLKKGGAVVLTGFGSFSVTKRAARAGRNPRTGEAIKIKARKVPKFAAGKGLKDAVA